MIADYMDEFGGIDWYEVEISLAFKREWRKTTTFVGGIEGGFTTPEEAVEFIESMKKIGDTLYENADWRVVKVTRRVVEV